MKPIPILALAAACLLAAPAAWADGADTADGELGFHRHCASCHALEAGQHRIGPSLFKVYGRKSASQEAYAYSQALRGLGLTWTDANLDPYLSDAQQFAPGSKMWVKLPDAQMRKDIVAFLKAQSSEARP